MASISTFPALHFPFSKSSPIPSHSFSLPSPTNFTLSAASFRHSPLQGRSLPRVLKQVRAVEEDASVPELGVESEASSPSPSDPPAVTVPVSPSDVLTMFFQVLYPFYYICLFWWSASLITNWWNGVLNFVKNSSIFWFGHDNCLWFRRLTCSFLALLIETLNFDKYSTSKVIWNISP